MLQFMEILILFTKLLAELMHLGNTSKPFYLKPTPDDMHPRNDHVGRKSNDNED